MKVTINNTLLAMAFVPVAAISTIGLNIASNNSIAANNVIELRGLKQDAVLSNSKNNILSEEDQLRKEKAAKIDSYFRICRCS